MADEHSMPEFIAEVTERLKSKGLDVASQWITGTIEEQERRAPMSGSYADLVVSNPTLDKTVVVEVKRTPLGLIEFESADRHRHMIESANERTRYLLVSPPSTTERSISGKVEELAQTRSLRMVVGNTADEVSERIADTLSEDWTNLR